MGGENTEAKCVKGHWWCGDGNLCGNLCIDCLRARVQELEQILEVAAETRNAQSRRVQELEAENNQLAFELAGVRGARDANAKANAKAIDKLREEVSRIGSKLSFTDVSYADCLKRLEESKTRVQELEAWQGEALQVFALVDELWQKMTQSYAVERDSLRADRDEAMRLICELLPYAEASLGGTCLRADWLAECRAFLERAR